MKCAFCGNDFQPHRLSIGRQRFCSNKCRTMAFQTLIPHRQRYRKQVECVICKREFETARHRPAETCSRACRTALWRQTSEMMRFVRAGL